MFSGCSTSKLNMDQDRLGLLKSTGRKSDLPGTILHQQEEPVSCKQLESLDAIGQEQKAAEVAALYKQLAEPETNYQNQEKGEKADHVGADRRSLRLAGAAGLIAPLHSLSSNHRAGGESLSPSAPMSLKAERD